MTNGDLFYICGIALALSAVAISFIGLKAKGFPGRIFPVAILWFVLLIGGATVFSVLHAKDEEQHKEAEFEHAGEEFEAEAREEATGESAPAGGEAMPKGEGEDRPVPAGGAGDAGGTLQLAADPSAIAYDATSLASKPGKVTIDFTNPSALEHDVAIEKDGEEIAKSEVIAESETSVSAELEPGTYTFLCTVPGHAEAGMKGTLSVE